MPLDWLLGLFSKLGSVLVRPRDQKALKDASSRQLNLFSKVENTTFIVNNPRTNEFYVADLDRLPPQVLDGLRGQLDTPDLDPRKKGTLPFPSTRLFRTDFYDDAAGLEDYLNKDTTPLRALYPYVDPQYESILGLASYSRYLYSQGKRHEADEIRNQIGAQYGHEGRKLCNLYLKGYVQDMFTHYLEPLLTSSEDKFALGVRLNTLLRKLVQFSEDIHFIHRNSNAGIIAGRITIAVKRGKQYIAIHSAGAQNVVKAASVLSTVGVGFLKSSGYEVIQDYPLSTSLIPLFDVYLVPKKLSSQTATEGSLSENGR